MATPNSLAKLKEALAAHVKAGGKNEVVNLKRLLTCIVLTTSFRYA